MKLTKVIPAKTITIKILWCRLDYLAMCNEYKFIRSKMRIKMTSCYWCKRNFYEGELIALACIENIGNRMLCRDCALKAKETEATK